MTLRMLDQQDQLRAHAESLDRALRSKVVNDGQRDSSTYPHWHPGAPATPFDRSPPNEHDPASDTAAVAGRSTVSQASAQPTASPAMPGARTTSSALPVGAETVHMPTSIIPSTSPRRRSNNPLPSDELDADSIARVGALIERSKTLKGTISRKLLPRPSDLSPSELRAYLGSLDVLSILGNTQAGLSRQNAIDPIINEGRQHTEGPPPPPIRPRKFHLERRRRIPELKARVAELTAAKDELLNARGHSCPPEIEHDAIVISDTRGSGLNSPERPMLGRRARSEGSGRSTLALLDTSSPVPSSSGSETVVDSLASGAGTETDATLVDPHATRAPPPITISTASPENYTHLYEASITLDGESTILEDDEDEEEEAERERLLKHLDDLSTEIASLTATAERLEKIADISCPLSTHITKNKNYSKGAKDDEMWAEMTGVAPGVRRYNAYGHVYDIERHVLSPAMSECTEAPTLTPRSSIGNLSITSSRSAGSVRSGTSAKSAVSSTSSQKLRRQSRSILQALAEDVPIVAQPEPIKVREAEGGPASAGDIISPGPSEADSNEWREDVARWNQSSLTKSSPQKQWSSPKSDSSDLIAFSPSSSPQKKPRSPRMPDGSRRKLEAQENESRHTSLSSDATRSSTISLHNAPAAQPVVVHHSTSLPHRKPPAALKTRLELARGHAGSSEWIAPLTVAQELELAGVTPGSPPGIRRVGEAVIPESPMRKPQSPPFGVQEAGQDKGDAEIDYLPPSYEASEASISPPAIGSAQELEGLASPRISALEISTTPLATPPRSPLFRDLEIPEIRVESPTTPAKSVSIRSFDGRMTRGSSSPGKRRSSSHLRNTLQLPLTEKQAARQAKEEARQAVWATRTEHKRLKKQFEAERDRLWDKMAATNHDGARAHLHWQLAELYIKSSDTVGLPAGIAGTKMMQECLAKYEHFKHDAKRWARYGQMHVWLRRNGSQAQANGGEQHLTIAVNAFTTAIKIAGEHSEFGGHCCMLAAQVLQEGARSTNQYYQAYQFWLRSVAAECHEGLDVRYAHLATCCDIMVSETLAGRCEGLSENWRAMGIDAMQRACNLNPANEEWPVRLAHFEACQKDEECLEGERPRVDQRHHEGVRAREENRRDSEARAQLESGAADETLSTISHFSHDDEETVASSRRDSTEVPESHAEEVITDPAAAAQVNAAPAAPVHAEETIDNDIEDPEQAESPESETTPRPASTISSHPRAETTTSHPSPAYVALPESPPRQVRTSDEYAVLQAQMVEQQRINARLLERLEAVEQDVVVMKERQEINLAISAMERDLQRLRERQDALDRRTG